MEAVIGASGSGIDEANWDELPFVFRIGINTAALKIPNCMYVAAVDHKMFLVDGLLDHNILLTTDKSLNIAKNKGTIIKSPTIIVEDLIYSMLIAIRYCTMIGVSKIHFVGCDFGKTKSNDLSGYYSAPSDFYVGQYIKIKELMLNLMDEYRIDYCFHGGVA